MHDYVIITCSGKGYNQYHMAKNRSITEFLVLLRVHNGGKKNTEIE